MKGEERQPPIDLKTRTRPFALRIIRLAAARPQTEVARELGKQVLRSGTAVGAQHREGVRSRSDAERVSKWGGALQDLEEPAYWLELLGESDAVPANRLTELARECHEQTANLTTCVKNVKAGANG